MHAKQMQALDLDPRDRGRVLAGVRPHLGRARPPLPQRGRRDVVVALGSVLGTIEDVVDELRDAGRPDRRARDHVLPAVPARRGPRGARARRARGRAREGVRGRDRRDRRPERAPRAVGPARRGLRRRRRASAAGRSRSGSLHGLCRRRARRAGSSPGGSTFLDLDRGLVERELQRTQQRAALRPARREHPPRPRHRRRRSRTEEATMAEQPIKFYQVGSFAVGNRLLDPDAAHRAGAHRSARTRSPRATAPARAAARRSAPATCSTPRCARPRAG